MTSDYFERGGVRFWRRNGWLGGGQVTWPFGTLRLTRNAVRVWAGPFARFDFAAADVVGLRPHRGLFCRGFRVEHRRPDGPAVLVFWSFTPRRLRAAAQAFGYRVWPD